MHHATAQGGVGARLRAIARILGYRPEELLGTLAVDHMLPGDREQVQRRMPKLVAARRGWERWRLRWAHRDGGVRILESTATPRFNAGGEFIGYRGVDQDITERLRQETHIRHLARIHAVLSALGNAIVRAKTREQLLKQVCQVAVEQGDFEAACISVLIEGGRLEMAGSYGNQTAIQVIEQLAAQPAERLPASHLRPELRAFLEARNVIIRDLTATDLPAWMRTDMEAVGIAAQVALPIGSPPWGVLGLYASQPQEFDSEEIELLRRLTSEVDYAVDFIAKGERLEYLAYNNPVTSLPNRAGFQQQLAAHLAKGPVVVAVVGVAHFSRINDSRGRRFGDQMLLMVGQRLQVAIGPAGILAHPGEDTFLLAHSVLGSVQEEVQRLDVLLRTLDDRPYEIGGERLFLHFNCGIAMSPEHGTDGETLERNAAAALAEAQRTTSSSSPFTDGLQKRSARRIELERELRQAVAQNEFELFYQPKFDADTKRLVGAEALLRWRHPQAGLVMPAEFIPVLEETEMIVLVGRWIMQTALDTALAWRARGHSGLRIAVNVSACELRNHRFLEDCRRLLEPHAADQLLDIEVTESLLMVDIEHSISLLQGLTSLGCRIAIDDFGTGYSSLNYLARLPVDVLKIDQSFTAQLTKSPQAMGLITSIISMAHSLSIKVVAEGVEDEEQAKLLRLLRCDELQGYLLGRPMPASEFAERLL